MGRRIRVQDVLAVNTFLVDPCQVVDPLRRRRSWRHVRRDRYVPFRRGEDEATVVHVQACTYS